MSKDDEPSVIHSSINSGALVALPGIVVASKTDIGRRREENQDSFVVIEKAAYKLLVVADGMGGARGGAVASSMAVLTMQEQFKGVRDLSVQKLHHAIAVANSRIYDESNDKPRLAGMGTTIVCVGITKDSIIVAHVGDSRAYRLRDGVMQKLTEDHTLVNELLKTGAITPDQAEHHPVSHMLTRSLGTGAEVDIDCRQLAEPPRRGDKFILMSDGLYNLVTRQEIYQELSQQQPLDTTVSNLIDLANDRGGTDNITIITSELESPFAEAAPQEKLVEIQERHDEIREPATSSEPGPSVHLGISSGQRTSKGITSYRVPLIPVLIIFFAAFGWGIKLSLMRDDVSHSLTIANVHEEHRPLLVRRGEFDPGHEDSVVHEDPTQLRQQQLREELKGLEAQQKLLQLKNAADISAALQRLRQRRQEFVTQKDEIDINKERATRKLTAWYSRKKRLETTDAVNLAREISASSETVKSKREAFEEVTWRYFKEAEILRYSPGDASVQARVSTILEERRGLLEELNTSVRKTIDEMILEAEHDLATLTQREDAIRSEEYLLTQQEQLLELLRAGDSSVREQRVQTVASSITTIKEELRMLEQSSLEALDFNDSRSAQRGVR